MSRKSRRAAKKSGVPGLPAVTEALHSAGEGVADVVADAAGAIGSAAGSAADAIGSAAESVGDAVSAVAETVSKKVAKSGRKANKSGRRARKRAGALAAKAAESLPVSIKPAKPKHRKRKFALVVVLLAGAGVAAKKVAAAKSAGQAGSRTPDE
jgi:chemotaxis response regulator CheB